MTGKDPLVGTQEVYKRKEENVKTTSGDTVKGRRNITFADEVTEEELIVMCEKPDVNQDALKAYSQFPTKVVLEALQATQHQKKAAIIKAIRLAPEFSLKTLSRPDMLNKFKIWP